MRIALVFPPFDPSVLIPEIGVPILAAALRSAGHDVSQGDWNQEFLHGYLGRLDAFAGPLAAMDGLEEQYRRACANDRDQLLAALARGWARPWQRHEVDEPLLAARAREREEGKSPHVLPHQVRRDWGDDLREMQQREPGRAGALLAALARHGARDPRFRRDLLRVIQHFTCLPSSYRATEVLAEVERPHPLLDPYLEGRLDDLGAGGAPGLLGLSIWSTGQLVPALQLARAARQRFPGIRIVAGGAWVTYARRQIPRVPALFQWIDYFVVHEGDRALLRIAGALDAGERVPVLPGVMTRTTRPGDDLAVEPPLAFVDTALPEYSGYPMALYAVPRLTLRLFRGCHWARCTFCTHTPHPYTRRHSFRRDETLPAAYLARLADHVREMGGRHGICEFTMADNVVSPAVMAQLCRWNHAEGLGFTWDSLARFESEYSPAFCRELARGGCQQLDLGLETAGNEALRQIAKGITSDQALENLRNLRDAGIRTKVFLLSYPGQGATEFERTLRFVTRHGDLISEVAISRFALALDTLPYHRTEQLGLRLAPDADPWLDVYAMPYEAVEELTWDEVVALTRQFLPGHW